MKLTKMRHASVAGRRALGKMKGGLRKALKVTRKKPLVTKAPRRTSILSIVPDTDTPRKKKNRRICTPDVSSSSEMFSSPGNAESSYYCSPGSHAPLVIDSPGVHCDQPAFTLADVSFESSDAEVSITPPKILQKKVSGKTKRFKRKRSPSNLSVSSEEIITSQDKDIGLFPVKEWDLLIAVLSHPMSIKLTGPALIHVISGSLKILGHVVHQFHGIVPIFSSSKVMCLDIKTESSENICRQASRLQVVKDSLIQNRVPESIADRILNLCDNSSVIVGFRKNYKSSEVHFASSLMPNVFSLKAKKYCLNSSDFKEFGFKLYTDNSTSMDFPQCENFISHLFSSIKDSDEKSIAAPRVVVQGIKGVGKSTFLRYAINRVLNEFDAVYYLDGDPGQSEFVPGGCVSLVKVTAPLLGPPFTHQTTPEKMYFLGTVDIQKVAEKYSICMQLLYEYYKEKCSVIPLFVNTMGWVVGTGLELLKDIKSFVEPTHIVKIVDEQVKGNYGKFRLDPEPMSSTAKEYLYDRFAPPDENKVLLNPAERRDLSMLAYLGKCQKVSSGVCSVNSITAICIRWKDVALYAGDEEHTTEHTIYSFIGAWVALLSVNESSVWECDDDPALPRFLSEDPVEQECYGFGIMKGIDVAKKVFHVLSPEPIDRLKKVNAIVKGKIQLPFVLHTQQDTMKHIMFVNQNTGDETIVTSKGVPRLKYRPNRSVTSTGE